MSEEIEYIIEESLSPDRYCLVHNYIVSLQQKVEQLENENKELKQPQVFIDCENMEERYGRNLYEDYLKEKIEQLESIRKEAIEYIKKNLTIGSILDGKKTYCLNSYSFDYEDLLNILNKGSDK